jgi:ComF family protein
VNNWLNSIRYWLYPATCVICGQPGAGDQDLCSGCRAALPFLLPACRRCAAPLPESALGAGLCGECQRHPPAFHAAFALLRYDTPTDHLIQRLKFGGRLQYARLLGELMAERLARRHQAPPQALIPVPLHPTRQRQRGFNQAMELARPISRQLGVPVVTNLCLRARATAAQSGLAARERRANLRDAFSLTGAPRYDHVALVDDVMTTGNTVDELARLLGRAGVSIVEVWSAARAV